MSILSSIKAAFTAAEPLLIADATVDIQAATETDKPAKVSILAYSGGIISLAGWGDLAIDLSGLELPASVPLLSDHDNKLSSVAGHGKPLVRDGKLTIQGELARSTPAAQQIITLSQAGVPIGASVGVNVKKREFIRPGEKVSLNGRTLTAGDDGLNIVRAGQLKEVSFTPIGADSTAGVESLAASKSDSMNTTITNDPEFQTWLAGRVEHPQLLTPDEIEMCRFHFDTEHGRTPAPLSPRAAALDQRRIAELEAIRAARPRGISGVSPSQSGMTRQAIECVLLARGGHEALAEKTYGPRAMETSRTLRATSLVDLCGACLNLDGRETSGMSRNEMIRAAFSTTSLPTALSNVTGKTLWESYMEGTSNWRGFAKILPAADFKPQVGIRPSFVGQLEQLPKDGEIKHGELKELTYPWKINTYAKMLRITREDVINDDLGFIQQTAPLMGKASARAVNDLVWSTIMANAGSFFSSGNGNLLEAASDLDLVSLGAAVSAMRKQRDAQNNDIDIRPRVLAVPPELETVARSLLNSEFITAAIASGESIQTPTGNPLRNSVELVVESRLSNTTKFADADTAAWFLFAGMADAPVIVGFLDGNQNPTVEFFGLDSEVNTLGVSWRVYHDFGVSLGDFRAAVKATGAS